jgi:CRP-like cAMP-binding protein
VEWPLLSVLDEDERRRVLALANRRRFAKGEPLFHEGDPGDTMHLIAKGHVALRVTTPLGDTATLLVLGPGDHFGEMALISPAPRNASAVALEPVETMTVHREQLEELRREHPGVDRLLMEGLIAEVRRLSHALLEALYVPVEKRVLRRLGDLLALYRDGAADTVTIPLTQEDLAELAGTTRPTANKVLKAVEEAGAVRIARGRIDVLNADELARRAR